MSLLLSLLATVVICTSAVAQGLLATAEQAIRGTQIAAGDRFPPTQVAPAVPQTPPESQNSKQSNEHGAQRVAPGVGSNTGLPSWWTGDFVEFLTTSILVFTVITLLLATVLLWRMNSTPQLVLKLFGLLTIIGMSAWLIVVGYSTEQLTPVWGLFGAVAGYLLGKETKPAHPPQGE